MLQPHPRSAEYTRRAKANSTSRMSAADAIRNVVKGLARSVSSSCLFGSEADVGSRVVLKDPSSRPGRLAFRGGFKRGTSAGFLRLVVISWCGLGIVNPGLAQNWMQTSAPLTNWGSVASSDDGTKLVAVAGGLYNGPIYTSTNSGKGWFPANAPVTTWAGVASSADGTRLVAIVAKYPSMSTNAGAVYVSRDSGTTWISTNAPNDYWQAVNSSADGNTIVALAGQTSGRPIYYSTNGAASWLVANAPNAYWRSVASSRDGRLLVASADPGLIYTSTNYGALWTVSGAPTYNGVDTYVWKVASSEDGTKLVVAGGGNGPWWGFIYRSTDSGATWTDTHAPSLSWCALASSTDGTRLVAAVWYSQIYISTDSGTTWTPRAVPPGKYWESVASSADGSKLVAAACFDALYTWQETPVLSLYTGTTNVVVSWPSLYSAAGFTLQENADLTATNWVHVPTQPVVTNLQNQVVLPMTAGSRFFRLISE